MRWTRLAQIVLILTAFALVVLPIAREAHATVECANLGGTDSGPNTPCVIGPGMVGPIGSATAFPLAQPLHITGILKVAPVGITINITGSIGAVQNGLQMDAGSQIDGDVNTAIPGAPITITAVGDIHLAGSGPGGTPVGAIIHSNALNTSCAGTNRGGNITLRADSDADLKGDVLIDAGSNTDNGGQVLSRSSCGRGEIIITGTNIDIDGDVLSQGTSTQGRGGPITLDASCNLTLSDFGSVRSLGRDPGADLVHLEGGCDMKIFGLVESSGAGHNGGANRCQPPNRPGKPTNSQACVEVWAGNSLVIDSRPPHTGQISADTGFSGGIQGTGWIDLLSRGPISLFGDTVTPYLAHANQGLGNGKGGTITVMSLTGGVSISGLGLQASDQTSGGRGGAIDIEAKLDVDLTGGRNEAAGANSGGGAQAGGQISVRSFGTGAGNGTIIGNSAILDVTGHTPPNGTVSLTACLPVPNLGFPPGLILPAGLPAGNVTRTVSCTDGAPVIPPPAVLPDCPCVPGGCACVASFTPTTGTNGATLTLTGDNMTLVDSVRFGTTCDPGSASGPNIVTTFTPTPTTITLTVPNIAANSNYKIIITTPSGGSCCAPGVFNKQ